MGKTLPEKVWERHLVHSAPDEPDLLYIDLHLVHEVTSPQAFDGLRLAGRQVRRPDRTVATADHNVPTDGTPVARMIADELSRVQVETLERNCEEFGVPIYSLGSDRQGIVHVIGPQLGLTQPGMTIVCGDSHTSTHGAFGALAFGIGTSEVEHVLATQTLPLKPFKTMAITVEGALPEGVTSAGAARAMQVVKLAGLDAMLPPGMVRVTAEQRKAIAQRRKERLAALPAAEYERRRQAAAERCREYRKRKKEQQ